MTILLASLSSLAMGLFYIMDMFFESRSVYSRPSQAMIISAIIPPLSVPFFIFSPWWNLPPTWMALMATIAGVLLIWANWFYFLVMFPVDKSNREADAIEGATELALYEGTTPALVLLLSLLLSQFIVYTDYISTGQGAAVFLTVIGLLLFATADGYRSFNRWSYRFKLITFAFGVAMSQLLQDFVVNTLQGNYGYTTVEAFASTAPFIWIGMFSGISIVIWKQEWSHFKIQWHKIIKQYVHYVLIAEVIALSAFIALIGSYTGEHVAVAGAIAASFPVVVFIGGIALQQHGIDLESSPVETKHMSLKLLFITITLLGVIGVALL